MKRTPINRMMSCVLGALLGAGICFFVLAVFFRPPPVDSADCTETGGTLPQIEMALAISSALYAGDYGALSTWVSPEKGLTVVPFSTVDLSANASFTAAEVRGIPNGGGSRLFGVNPNDGGTPITLPPAEFFETYMRTHDFSRAPVIGVNRVVMRGNAEENVAEAFPNAVFIDLYHPPSDPAVGVDWVSMKVVLEPLDNIYTLVALVRGVYTLQ